MGSVGSPRARPGDVVKNGVQLFDGLGGTCTTGRRQPPHLRSTSEWRAARDRQAALTVSAHNGAMKRVTKPPSKKRPDRLQDRQSFSQGRRSDGSYDPPPPR